MEIKATCKLDLESITALSRLSFGKQADPRKKYTVYMLVMGILALYMAVNAILLSDAFYIVLILVAVAVMALESYLFFGVPRVSYNAMAKMKNLVNVYTFTDECLYVTTTGSEYSGEGKVAYTLLGKAYETSRYFFLYQTNRQVLVVDKTTVTGGSPLDIREKLSGYVQKYYICRY